VLSVVAEVNDSIVQNRSWCYWFDIVY